MGRHGARAIRSTGIQFAETPNADQPIARASAQLTAFVGRTLRGPLNQPIAVRSFADFQQHFGGLWQPSPLSYAVEHFFEQGGRQAIIVRVANGAAPVTISLRCGTRDPAARSRAPGTREFLRASIDYDHIDPATRSASISWFNACVRRVPSASKNRKLSARCRWIPQSPRFVAVALLESDLVRVRGDVPKTRPDRTLMPGTQSAGRLCAAPIPTATTASPSPTMTSSAPRPGAGLFALDDVDELAFVYIPPLARKIDVGVSALLVAARFCRDKRAMLIVDPPATWETPARGDSRRIRALDFRSDNALMFFPRIVAMDRLRGRRSVWQRRGGRWLAVALGRGGCRCCRRRWSRNRCCVPAQARARSTAPIAGCSRRKA